MRRFLVAGNWKMNGSLQMTADLISGVSKYLESIESNGLAFDVLVCPPTAYLAAAEQALIDTSLSLGAQNVSAHKEGAYTGEVALPMLSEFACEYVLLGHSERRELFAESDQQIAEKFAACVNSPTGIKPVLCIGETLAQRQAGTTESILTTQLDAVLELVGVQGFSSAVVAYEPVWAIGTGETASPEQAQEVHKFIRDKFAKLDQNIADNLQILYGGSMKPSNAPELLAQSDIDGGLIGGAALKVESFTGICAAAHNLSN